MLKPLGDRVLVKPIEPAAEQTTDSGLVLPNVRDVPITMGTVMFVGDGTEDRLKMARAALAKAAELIEINCSHPKAAVLVCSDVASTLVAEPLCKVGECVTFAASAGEDVEFNGEPYIMLREKDILAVVEA